jgi:threonine dehydrogenase-like Zn-dependent dehydrogenase
MTSLAEDAAITPGYDLVVEATGSAAGLARAMALVRPRGRIVLKSTYAGSPSLDLAPLVINEVTVIGSRCGTFPRALAALERGRVDPRPLIAAQFPLSEGEAAFRRAAEPGVMKVLVSPSR